MSSRSTREAYVANTTTGTRSTRRTALAVAADAAAGPDPAHKRAGSRWWWVRTPSRSVSFSSEHTATIGTRCPTRRHAWAVCTSRGPASAQSPGSGRPGKCSSAHTAAVIVLPEPVAAGWQAACGKVRLGGDGDRVAHELHVKRSDPPAQQDLGRHCVPVFFAPVQHYSSISVGVRVNGCCSVVVKPAFAWPHQFGRR